MDLEDIMLSQTQKDHHCIISLIRGIKNKIKIKLIDKRAWICGYQRWECVGVGDLDEDCQKAQTCTYKINKS